MSVYVCVESGRRCVWGYFFGGLGVCGMEVTVWDINIYEGCECRVCVLCVCGGVIGGEMWM